MTTEPSDDAKLQRANIVSFQSVMASNGYRIYALDDQGMLWHHFWHGESESWQWAEITPRYIYNECAGRAAAKQEPRVTQEEALRCLGYMQSTAVFTSNPAIDPKDVVRRFIEQNPVSEK